jgi:hypothetical protein
MWMGCDRGKPDWRSLCYEILGKVESMWIRAVSQLGRSVF